MDEKDIDIMGKSERKLRDVIWIHRPLRYYISKTISSSPSSYSNFYVESMYDDIRLHVARSYTSSADSPFSLMSSFTLSNHLLLGLPLFLLPCTFITIALLPT